ncbi:transcriptional repressor [Deferribacterales bacterium Es71-Z0220]|jgi:Fe2+ or Zn2+ uptake regulation protein|uniref:Fur family transcriptional regulator n=1 Tax=Deferrivibrio essentukiensis TaxID=2880922 RepID=UPI001F62322C|nr:transcriptional repressor [Deferrivibrio essentukiensis]MBZ4672709.1 Fur family transcriptional regulator, peroxide stress response regulator [Deferribacteraceae bacterium]MCB4204395.1 transcriptional repressor [Deferrivibrio essentukiensis]
MRKFTSRNLLKNNKLKVTPQRTLLLDIISKYGHIDTDSIVTEITSTLPSVSVATVYKNLSTLIENGIVKEVNFPGKKKMYELNINKHIHLVCSKCGNIRDIDMSESLLKEKFRDIIDDEIDDFNINFYYTCKSCKKS